MPPLARPTPSVHLSCLSVKFDSSLSARRTPLARCHRPSTIQACRAGIPMPSWNSSAVHDGKLHTNRRRRRHLRSASQWKMIVPRYRMDSYGRRCFAVAGQSTWNSLPDGLCDPALSLSIFRRQLKTYFFAKY